ncbi:Por secretion system C-terminal sorting domain-containing protein [Mariniphaga anaerophila]|uniref:Por secretion system C-terminal sorting domain-containing protein n=1 Tax=Mariniphaga anaerophila TaxID=1484053 RepID=A0A1M5GEP2_9BACT|nr:T9SS type A sorting domain-containing protein [Mariniphaga anaerophila]SHG02260.1 Por secretion system C-terminal sorting domain-containing protein [Mariniphaga anaerophila]
MKQKISTLILINLFALMAFGEDLNKSNLTDKFRLDSIITVEWNFYNNQWQQNERSIYSYDSENNMTKYRDCYYEYLISKWIDSDKDEFLYDSKKKTTEHISYRKYSSQVGAELIPGLKLQYTYNSNELIDSSLLFGWNNEQQQWNNSASSKETYTYNKNFELITKIIFSRDENTNEWKNSNKTEYYYNSEKNKSEEVSYYVKRNTDEWYNLERTEYTYDVEENWTKYLRLFYDEETNQWTNKSKIEFVFLTDTLQPIYYSWDKTTEEWIYTSSSNFVFDSNSNLIEVVNYNGKDDKGNWIPFTKNTYSYDLSVKYAELILPPSEYILNGIFNSFKRQNIRNKPLDYTLSYWDAENKDWKLYKKGTFYYSQFEATSVNVQNTSGIYLYPNPVNDILFFKTSITSCPIYFKLYDVLGNEILKKELDGNNSISTANLKEGCYFYIIETNGILQKGKLIKK